MHAELNPTPTFVILGATGSVGGVLAEMLAQRGARLLLAARDTDGLTSLADRLGTRSVRLDARDMQQVDNAVHRAVEIFGQIDGVANCIGSLLLKPAHLTTDEEWLDQISINLGSSFACVRAAAKAMRERGGSVVLVSSAAARIGLPNHEAIAAAKSGVEGLVRSAAATYGSKGIRINAVAPGLVRSKMTQRIWKSPAAARASEAMHAAGRLGEPVDVASMIAWLLDPACSWVTGQVFGIDGGLATVRPKTGK